MIAALARQSSVAAVKIKIGADLAGELRQLRELRQICPAAELRLDGNRRFAHAGELADFAALRPRFIEEPLASGLRADLPFPVAADETLQRDDTVLEEATLAAAILKPMTLGGPARCLALAERARARDIGIVVSHSFDGPLARGHALALAAALPGLAAGLAPHFALSVLGVTLALIDDSWARLVGGGAACARDKSAVARAARRHDTARRRARCSVAGANFRGAP